MEEERIKRYNDKLEYLNQTIKNLNDWTENLDSKEFIESLELQKQYGIYHAFQIGIEIITDLISMIVKDVKMIPKDDYSNINIIKNKKIVNTDLAAKLREANGLDNELAFNRLKNLLKYFQVFKVEAKEWLKKNC